MLTQGSVTPMQRNMPHLLLPLTLLMPPMKQLMLLMQLLTQQVQVLMPPVRPQQVKKPVRNSLQVQIMQNQQVLSVLKIN